MGSDSRGTHGLAAHGEPRCPLFLAVSRRRPPPNRRRSTGTALSLATSLRAPGVFFPVLLGSAKRMPLLVALLGMAFNLLNGWINARWISDLGHYDSAWLLDPRFLLGATAFVLGFLVNVSADRTLLRLRRPGDTGYRIPHGRLFEWVSCPNYLGEIVEWFGWALATWSLAGLAFAVYTVANLAPRALAHHAWYRKHFPAYPKRRRALLPFVL